MDLEQQVFLEEQQHLNDVERKLNKKIRDLNKKVEDYSKQVRGHISYDYDDVDVWRLSNASLIRYTEDRDSYKKSVDEPYHARLDLYSKESDKIETYYIGKQGLYIDKEQLVLDWRTDIAMLLSRKTETNYKVDGNEYELSLRRSFDIQKSILKYVNTEYDGDSVTLEGEIVDPFLIKVLKDKRRQNRLTDIIKTIQSNQNDIIRRPLDETFVVQGCAGSGKTMILLHRLSYLIFNNKDLDLSRTIIITPNKLFDNHVNDLSNELGLNKVRRFSVEEYYKRLINEYSLGIDAKSIVESEKSLNLDLLSEIYSLEFYHDFIKKYHAYWENVMDELEKTNIEALLKKYSIKYESIINHKFLSQVNLESAIKECGKKIEKKQLDINQYDSKIADNQTKLEEAKNDFIFGKSQFEKAQNKYVERASEERKRIDDFLDKFTLSKEKDLERQSFLNKAIIELEKKIDDSSKISVKDTEKYSNFDLIVGVDNEIAAKVIEKNKKLVENIKKLNEEFKKIPAYNFGKRNRIKRQLLALKEEFRIVASNSLKDFADETQNNVEIDINQLSQYKDEVSEIMIRLVNVDKNIENLNVRLEKLDAENKLIFNNLSRIDRKSLEEFTFHSEAKKLVDNYKRYLVNQNAVEYYTKLVDDLIRLHPTEKDIALVEEEMELIKSINKIIKKISLSGISKNVYFKELTAMYRKYNQKYTSINYRHKLYLKLLLVSLYGTKPNITDKFINIDEAQDISVAEYRLIQSILRKDVIFNLYGDVNQLVYSYKGIQDWCEISGIAMDNIYVLNENYRNTTQITDFCNKEFDSEIYPIGIAGDKVEELDIFEAISWIKKIKQKNLNYRIAIIYRHGKQTVHDVLSQVLNRNSLSWDNVDNNKISVLTVEEAKGLEFEVVVAIVDEMTDNEKYISYTRALSNLCVVRNVFEEKIVENNFDEKTLEENYDF